MESDHTIQAEALDPRLEDLVFDVICARARRNFDALPIPALRGMMSRVGLRPFHLKALGARPLDILNGSDTSGAEGALMGSLFASAAARKSASIAEPGREAFLARLEALVSRMHERTSYRFKGDIRACCSDAAGQHEDTDGMALPEVLETLLRSLPPITPVRPPRRPAMPQIAPPKPPPLETCRRGLSLDRHPPPAVARHSSLALLEALLPPLEAPAPAKPEHETNFDYEPMCAPRLSRAHPIALRSPSWFLAAEGLTPKGRRRLSTAGVGAMICLLVGSLGGIPMIMEGIVARSAPLVGGGATLLLLGVGAELGLRVAHRVARKTTTR